MNALWDQSRENILKVVSILRNTSYDSVSANLESVVQDMIDKSFSPDKLTGEYVQMASAVKESVESYINGFFDSIPIEEWSAMDKADAITLIETSLSSYFEKAVSLDKMIKDYQNLLKDSSATPEEVAAAKDALAQEITAFNGIAEWDKTLPGVDFLLAIIEASQNAGAGLESLETELDAVWAKIKEKHEDKRIGSLVDEGFAKQIKWMEIALNKAVSGGGDTWAKNTFASWLGDPKMLEAMLSNLDLFSDFSIKMEAGDYVGALELITKGLKSTDEAAESLKESLKDVREKLAIENTKGNSFIAQMTDLAKFLPTKQSLGRYMTEAFGGGNVDLVMRPQIELETGEIATLLTETMSTSDWDDLEFDQDVVVNLTPITPDGKELTTAELENYFLELAEKSKNAQDFINADKVENGGLGLLLYAQDVDGELDEAIKKAAEWADKLHEIQGLYYGGMFAEGEIDTEGIMGYISSLSDGMQEALFTFAPELEKALALMDSDVLAEQEAGARLFEEAILSMANAWDRYAEAYLNAHENEIDNETGIGLMKDLSAAFDTGGIDGYQQAFAKLTAEQKAWIEANSDGHDDMIKAWKKGEDGIEDSTKAMKKFNREMRKIDLDEMAESGEIWQEVAAAADENIDTTAELYDVYGKFKTRFDEVIEAQGNLNYVMSASDKTSEDYQNAINSLNNILPFTIQSEEDLAMAQQWLADQMGIAGMSSGYLLNILASMTGINFSADNWETELQNLADSGNAAAGIMIGLISTLRAIDNASVTVDNGVFSVNNLGNISGVRLPSSSHSSSGGGGGSSNSSSNEMSEIEKMLDLMEQIQKIREHQMSLISATRDYYQETGNLTAVMQLYAQERDALSANNEVIEENIRRIEELMAAKQAELAAMSTSDANYEQVASDLEALQEAHQNYTLSLIENQTQIEAFNNAIEEIENEIRDMEIDLRETIHQAILDREERNERMLQGTIDVENEILDVLKERYEKERDLAIETAEAKIEALEAESRALDEQFEKRKRAADQEDKMAKLAKLEAQLARISADPTRKKEELELRRQIAELRDELAWDLAEEEVEAQQESIDQQITSLEDYIEQVEQYYEDLFEHPQQLIAEMQQIMQMTEEEIIQFLQANSEEYANSTEAMQQDMVNSWHQMFLDMAGETETYWEEVEEIIAGGDEAIIAFLMENCEDYRNAGQLQAEAYVDEWRKKLEDLRNAYQGFHEEIVNTTYTPIAPSTGSSSSSSSSGPGPQQQTEKYQYGYKNNKGNWIKAGVESPVKEIAFNKAKQAAITHWEKYRGQYGVAEVLRMLNSASVASPGSYLKQFAKGGIASFTGPAWLDGTSTSPERILSPYQTKLFEDMIATLHQIKVTVPTMPTGIYDGTTNNAQAITFGDIILNVDQLSDDTDIEEMVDRIMEEIKNQMSQDMAVGGIRMMR